MPTLQFPFSVHRDIGTSLGVSSKHVATLLRPVPLDAHHIIQVTYSPSHTRVQSVPLSLSAGSCPLRLPSWKSPSRGARTRAKDRDPVPREDGKELNKHWYSLVVLWDKLKSRGDESHFKHQPTFGYLEWIPQSSPLMLLLGARLWYYEIG